MKETLIWVVAIMFSAARTYPADYWISTYESTGADVPYSVQQTTDGGFIVAGTANWNDGWIVKLDSSGSIGWQKTYGGKKTDLIKCICQTQDGGFCAVGETTSFGAGSSDGWAMKIDSKGKSLWQKTIGGKGSDGFLSCDATSDGGLIVGGFMYPSSAGKGDVWLLRLDGAGNTVWQKTCVGAYDGAYDTIGWSVHQTSDGGFFAIGPKDIDESLLIRTDSAGNLKWSNILSHSDYFAVHGADILSDGGIIAAGVIGVASSTDGWLSRFDQNGKIIWQKRYGGPYGDRFHGVRATPDGGCIAAGETYSWSSGQMDAWVIKVNSAGKQTWQKRIGGLLQDKARDAIPTSDGGYLFVADTRSHTASYEDWMFAKVSKSGEVDTSCGSFISSTTLKRYNAKIKSVSFAPQVSVPQGVVKKVNFASHNSSVVTEYLCQSPD